MSKILRKRVLQEGYSPQYLPTIHKLGRGLRRVSMEQIVQDEIQSYKRERIDDRYYQELYEKNPDALVRDYLNNFILHLLSDGYRVADKELDRWQQPMKKFSKKTAHSKVYLRQTPQEFYETVDRTVKECDIDMSEIDSLWKTASPTNNHASIANRLILSTYIKLREQGYEHEELTK